MTSFDLTRPPWSVEAGGTGNSDDWGDEQDRSEWFEEAANHYAARAAVAEAALARIPYESISALVNYNYQGEWRDFEENQGADAKPDTENPTHVYEHIVRIEKWLDAG